MSQRRRKIGMPPGSVLYTGNKKTDNVQIHYLQYDKDTLEEEIFNNHKNVVLRPSSDQKTDWYDIRGIHDTALIEYVGKTFGIHSLILEDVSDVHLRPKFEEYDNGIFIIIKAISFNREQVKVESEQVALYLKKGLVITFQETKSDLFEMVRKRIHNNRGRIRQRESDYLVYALMDLVVDHYFLVIEGVEEEIEKLEDRVVESQDSRTKSEIHSLKKELISMRKSIAPLREAIGKFEKSDSPIISENTTVFVRNLYDHTIQVMDTIESFRDILNGLQDLFISEVSFKMNQVMQVLTIVSTIFIPLTFLAGIYGMNFDHIPELHYRYGYFILLGIMLIIFIGLLYFFKKKNWL